MGSSVTGTEEEICMQVSTINHDNFVYNRDAGIASLSRYNNELDLL